MTQMSQNRIEWIDTAKGLGLILVILGHLHIPYAATWIYFFHMPLFFFLSGTVYSGQKYNFKDFIIRKIKSLIIPYFTLGIVIWLFYAVVNIFISTEDSLYGSNIEMLKGMLVQEHYWTIWFLAALFLTEVIYYFMDKLVGNNKIALLLISILVCVFGLIRYRLGWGSLPWNLDIALVAQFFYHIGRWFRYNNKLQKMVFSIKKRDTIFCMMVCLGLNILFGCLGIKLAHSSLDMSVGLYGNELLTILSAFSGIFFTLSFSYRYSNRFVRYLGQNTMVIFAWHSRIVIVLCEYIYNMLGIFQGNGLMDRLAYTVTTFTIILVLCIPITEGIKRSKLHFMFGL